MLSLKEGRKIARIKGGKHDGEFVYIKEDADTKFDDVKNPIDHLSDAFFQKYRKLPQKDINTLRKSIRQHKEPNDENLIPIYHEAMMDIQKNMKSEINIKDGKLIPLPNKSVVEKIYVSAPSGAGKSTWCSNYIKEYRKMFKDDEIYLFSSIDKDKVLDKYEPIRVPLDIELTTEPMDVEEEMANSLAIFDDIDTIQHPRIRNYVINLRDHLLECGRHFNVRMLSTSHILMNYKSTRKLLNEATAVCLFPKSAGTYHIKRFLKLYAGMEQSDIKKFLNLPSRWVCLYKTYPMYVIHEHGVYLLNKEEDGRL